MNPRRALIDTSAIYAFIYHREEDHLAATAFMQTWFKDGKIFLLPELVFVETMNLIRSRMMPEVAVRVGNKLRHHDSYVWIETTAGLERDTWAIFRRYQDKSWSYTDCHILALARSLQVPRVFTFDSHFTQMPEVQQVP